MISHSYVPGIDIHVGDCRIPPLHYLCRKESAPVEGRRAFMVGGPPESPLSISVRVWLTRAHRCSRVPVTRFSEGRVNDFEFRMFGVLMTRQWTSRMLYIHGKPNLRSSGNNFLFRTLHLDPNTSHPPAPGGHFHPPGPELVGTSSLPMAPTRLEPAETGSLPMGCAVFPGPTARLRGERR